VPEYGAVPPDPTETAAVGTPARFGIDLRRVPWIAPLAADYAHGYERLSRFYAGDPSQPAAWREAMGRAARGSRQNRAAVSTLLTAQLDRRGAPAEARAAAASLADPRTVAVVTGQQAGLFGGPLYTLLKAITALQLARRVSDAERAVAIFWIDAEDHDWDEVRGCTVLDGDLVPREIELARPAGAGELPVGTLTLGDGIGSALDALSQVLPRTGFTDALIDTLRHDYAPSSTMADAFGRLLDGLLGPHGLIVFDAGDPAAKPLVADLFVRELREAPTSTRAAAAGAALSGLGYAAQVTPAPDAVALFYLDPARRAIRREASGFAAGEARFPRDALIAEASAHPARFSPNVLLRPLVQDTLFPTVAYVAGPSELAYLGQLRGVYDAFGVPMPLVHPRASATLLDSAAMKFLQRHDFPLEDLQAQDEAALNRLLEAQLPTDVESALRHASDAVHESMRQVIDVIPGVDPTLAGAARSTLGKMEHDLKALHTKVIQAAKRRDDILRRQFTRAQALAFPGGEPQERRVGFVSFLNRYGPPLVDRLLADLPIEPGSHWVLTI
jgi:bacillithiol biosynthesis cysteine-adding enzyme BshC